MSERTPLYLKHLEQGGVMVDFAGYELPVRYPKGIIAEHNAVRNAAGLFDVSHMGEFTLKGKDAVKALNRVLTNDFTVMDAGRVRYSLMCYPGGGAVDDVLVYKKSGEDFLIVVNAANKDKDFEWMSANIDDLEVEFEDISDKVAQLALQGPRSKEILCAIADSAELPEKYYSFKENVTVGGVNALVSRTGYTGEDGYELYCAPSDALKLYDALMIAGAPYGLIPAGLGARDTLRTEAAMPLYGHELRADYPVSEAGLDFAIKYTKEDFIGKAALLSRPPQYVRIGVKVADRGIVREGTPIFTAEGEEAGIATSGTMAPSLGYAIAMLRVRREYADCELCAEVRGKRLKLARVPLPFYKAGAKN